MSVIMKGQTSLSCLRTRYLFNASTLAIAAIAGGVFGSSVHPFLANMTSYKNI